jgi:hypothetical protein
MRKSGKKEKKNVPAVPVPPVKDLQSSPAEDFQFPDFLIE